MSSMRGGAQSRDPDLMLLPALRVSLRALIEAQFASQLPVATLAADGFGFVHNRDIHQLALARAAA